MKIIMKLLLCALCISLLSEPSKADAEPPLAPGDKVFVVSPKLPVYVQAEAEDPVVEEMIPGMVSHILKVQKDSKGITWLYLADDAYGWTSYPTLNR